MRKHKNTIKVDYSSYQFSKKEVLSYFLQSVGICWLLNRLFYQSVWAYLFMLPVPFLFFQWKRRQKIKDRRRVLHYQFKDALSSLCVAVQAGYSMENAVSACARDMEKLYGREGYIVMEFCYMESQLKVSVPVEQLFLDLGERSGIEDVESFAAIFSSAKRTGGNMGAVLQKTARMIGEKIDVKKEIQATLAAKKSEQFIMSMMPFAIILYMQVTSPGFLQILYGNAFGAAAMTICLGIYFLAFWLGQKIINIEV
ncbi:MAG: type II secretion system F family protein [Blautia sp.]|jgi:tight adherence protein B